MTDLQKKVTELRKEYQQGKLDESSVPQNPLDQFKKWFEEALNADCPEANALALGTADSTGRPSVRMVLLRGFDDRGFKFFTNYDSRKGKQIGDNPQAAMTFFWPELERQIRIEGRVEFVSETESDEYFMGRPRGSRIGAWASPQSGEIQNRDFLEELVEQYKEKFDGGDIHRPENWGGYRLVPDYIEFWQGRPSRLHDRILYKKAPESNWKIVRLAP